MKRKTTEQFIEDAKKVHGDKYDYSLVDYINDRTKIKIICPEHGIFEQLPNSHLQGINCYFCGRRNSIKKRSKTTEQFIEDAKKVHGDKYDYSSTIYINKRSKLNIICKKHGIFEQTPPTHLSGNGCSKCSQCKKLTTSDFIEKAKQIHDKYDYSSTTYINKRTKLKVICPIHGIFEILPNNFLYGKQTGCPKCTESKGEKQVRELLEKNNILYVKQKSFKDCKNKNPLHFDFYLPKYNCCIEYDGIQHFKPVKYWNGITYFDILKKRDNIKNEYCKINNIHLIRIKYDENINDILNQFLNVISNFHL
jgi:hypothetical protein